MGFFSKNHNFTSLDKLINDVGILSASKFIGGIEEFINLYGRDNITRDMMINYLKEIAESNYTKTGIDRIFLDEIGIESILLDENKKWIKLIESFSENYIYFDIYEKPFDVWVDDRRIPYLNLSDEVLIELFFSVCDVYKF